MSTFSVAIPLEAEETIHSEQEVVEKLYKQRASLIYHTGAQEAVDSIKKDANRLLVVQLERVETTNHTYHPPRREEKIVELTRFQAINSNELVGNVKFQSFSPKFRKVSLLRAYIDSNYTNDDEHAERYLNTLLTTIHPLELPALVKILDDDGRFKNNKSILQRAVNTIEDAFIERQKLTDLLWTIGAILTLSIAYWIRRAFFPESFGYFIKRTFSYEEVEKIRENKKNFWDAAHGMTARGWKFLDSTYEKRTKPQYLAKLQDETAFHEKLFTSKKNGLFNPYGQLRKRLINHPETRMLEFIGTEQQLGRWLFFESAKTNDEKNRKRFEENTVTTMRPKTIIIDEENNTKKEIENTNPDFQSDEYEDFLWYHHTPAPK